MLHASAAFGDADVQIFLELGERYMGGLSILWGGGGLNNSLETMKLLNTLLKCSIRKIFVIKKCFPNNNDLKINDMQCSVKLKVRAINGKESHHDHHHHYTFHLQNELS